MPCPTKHSVPNMVNGVILGSGFPPSPPESRSHQPCAPASSARPGSPLPAQPRPWVRATSGESQGCGAGSLRLCLWPPLTAPGGGGQRLLGNGQSEALKLPWVRPTELLGLPSTLPDVTLLLADGTVRLERGGCVGVWPSGAPEAVRAAPRGRLLCRSQSRAGAQAPVLQMARAVLDSHTGSGTRFETHPPTSWPCDLRLVPRSL